MMIVLELICAQYRQIDTVQHCQIHRNRQVHEMVIARGKKDTMVAWHNLTGGKRKLSRSYEVHFLINVVSQSVEIHRPLCLCSI